VSGSEGSAPRSGGQGGSGARSGRPHTPKKRPGKTSGNRPGNYRKPDPDPSRRTAFEALRLIDERDAYANLVLPPLLRERGIVDRDAAFTTELVYGTLRGRGTYDAVLAACTDRRLEEIDPPVLDVLRLGAHQLLAMRVPSHAAVSATVELARAVLGESRATFVNALLRRVSERTVEEWFARVAPDGADDPLGRLAVTESHPRWIVSAMRDALAGDLAETEAMLAADNAAPAVTLVARPGWSTTDELLRVGGTLGRWSPYAVILDEGDPGRIEAVRSGRAGVQDEGSQLVAAALAAVPVEGTDARWLDLCAGPGGKAALLAALAEDRGATLTAVEPQPHRVALVSSALNASRTVHEVVEADGTDEMWDGFGADRVLVDVPCTGLGALRRRPEARWRRTPDAIASLAPLQRALLSRALDAVRPGGVVAYVTCSPHLAETRMVVSDVLKKRTDIERLDARALMPAGMPGLGEGPDVQLWPHRHGTDAMYLALLRRTT
jgi:16S rRNA (cytosine967-C5)-methyltransferase